MHKEIESMKGMPGKFPDGEYICLATFTSDLPRVKRVAEKFAKKYSTKIKVTERKINGSPVYGVWVKV